MGSMCDERWCVLGLRQDGAGLAQDADGNDKTHIQDADMDAHVPSGLHRTQVMGLLEASTDFSSRPLLVMVHRCPEGWVVGDDGDLASRTNHRGPTSGVC